MSIIFVEGFDYYASVANVAAANWTINSTRGASLPAGRFAGQAFRHPCPVKGRSLAFACWAANEDILRRGVSSPAASSRPAAGTRYHRAAADGPR